MSRVAAARSIALAAAVALSTACAGASPGSQEATASAPSLAELRAATFVGLDVADTVMLRDGRWEGRPFVPGSAARPTASLAPGFLLTGDLDGDSIPEAVVALATSGGGSGSLVWAAIMGRHDGTITTIATIPLGDRVQIRGGGIDGRLLTLDILEAGPNDPACCPGNLVTRRWALEVGGAVLAGETTPVRLSLGALTGVTWVLRFWGGPTDPPDTPAVTISWESVDEPSTGAARAAGSTGCNSYSVLTMPGSRSGELRFGPFTTTRMQCPEPVAATERRYLDLLARVTRFGFLAGRLALSYVGPDGRQAGVLLFDRAAPTP